MTLPRTIADYGAPKVNAIPVDDPTTTVSDSEYCQLASDAAQMTCTSTKAWVHFATQNANGACGVSAGGSHLGIGSLQLPAVARLGVGHYTVTYPVSWTDTSAIVGQVGKTEPIYFIDSSGGVRSATAVGAVFTTENGCVISVYVRDPLAAWALSDLTNGTTIRVEGR